MAATMFSILATLKLGDLNARVWPTWYFQQCAAAAGRTPTDVEPFLPWNLLKSNLPRFPSRQPLHPLWTGSVIV